MGNLIAKSNQSRPLNRYLKESENNQKKKRGPNGTNASSGSMKKKLTTGENIEKDPKHHSKRKTKTYHQQYMTNKITCATQHSI